MENWVEFGKKEAGGWSLRWPAGHPGGLLALDIETLGLDARAHEVTCACVCGEWDGGGGERAFVFVRLGADGRVERRADYEAQRDALIGLLDAAPRLCAFNGARFDLPFLAARWGVEAERVGRWVRKLVDPFEACKLALGRTCSLERLLGANGLAGKTGSGLQAVVMAREGRWDELVGYCMEDTRKTLAVARLAEIQFPG